MAEVTLEIEDKYIDQVAVALVRCGYEVYLAAFEKDRLCVKVPDEDIHTIKREG
jgi:hypothetical protein